MPNLNMDVNSILRQPPNIDFHTGISDGTVIQQQGKLHTLNTTASEILELFDGSMTVAEVINKIDDRYPGENVRPIIEDVIKQLKEASILIE